MTYSIIPKSHLEGALRLDPEYYQPEYLEYLNKIKKFKVISLGDAASILRGNTPKEYGDFEVPIVRSGDLDSNFFLSGDLLNAKDDNIFYLRKNDILISSIGFGSIGKVNIFTGANDSKGTVSEVTVIRESKINSFYIWAFLKSKYGQFQINREITGATGQLHLNTGNVENIVMPLLKNLDIFEKLYVKADKIFEKSNSQYAQAEDLLLEELGIKDLKSEEDLSFTTTLKDCLRSERIDAEFFQPKYENILSKIKVKKEKLSDLVSWQKGIEPGSEEYVEEGKPFIRVSNMSKFGLNDNNQQFLSEKLYNELKDKYQPQKGEILLSKDATPGITVLLGRDVEGIISGGILRLKIKDKNLVPQYLSLVLNSLICQMQIERDAGGSIIIHWRPDQVENTIIPILPLKTQQKIADLVNESFKLRKEAKELLEEAKKRVEEEIEKKK
ncbi:MAG: restriction endonuclease subunit S [Candidatus Parcubacteria bacterium]|nr:restriction endonuclease subunit S [Candidatus Parcubacteria bacterium]